MTATVVNLGHPVQRLLLHRHPRAFPQVLKGISPLLQGVMPDTAGFAIPLLIWIHLLLDFPKSTHRRTGENHPPFQADIFYRYPNTNRTKPTWLPFRYCERLAQQNHNREKLC